MKGDERRLAPRGPDAGIGGLAWYVARVAPQRELRAVDALEACGVSAFTPLRERWRRVSEAARRVTFLAPAAPGYVFVGLDPAFPRWVSVLGCRYVVRMLGGDRPRSLSPAAVLAALAMSEAASEERRTMPAGREYAVGDEVEMVAARFGGLAGTVTGLERGEARLLLRLFGSEVRARAPIWGLARRDT